MTVGDLPPLPWTYETNSLKGEHEGSGFVYLLDANGRKIGTLWGRPHEKIAMAQLITGASEGFVGGKAAKTSPHA